MARSEIPVVSVAVYVVPYARFADGVKVAVVPLRVADPVTDEAPALSWKVAVLTFFTASLNVAVTGVLTETAVAPLTGLVALTVGGVLSGAAPVVNDQV